MRVSSSMYYKNLYAKNNNTVQSKLFDVNRQIASGLKIQYAKEDVRAFAETMRLDNEIEGLSQIKQSTKSGYKMANQTDDILNEFVTTMDRMRVLMVNAANGIHSDGSLDAIADELRVVETHFKNLANTSINGQYLFSGSAVDIRPIADDGTYMGNDGHMDAFTGSKTKQQYNISGEELFLGDKDLVRRRVTTNVINKNLVEEFPGGSTEKTYGDHLTPQNSIRQLMGDTDAPNANPKHHFYIRGVQSDGTAFSNEVILTDGNTVQDLMDQIGAAYGNTNALKLVNVSMNLNGEFVIEDKVQGSSKLEFHMVGATDYNEAGADLADINDPVYGANAGRIDNLDAGEKNHDNFVTGITPPGLFVKEFIKSDYISTTPTIANIDGLLYDRTYFEKESTTIKGTIPQITRDGNAFATEVTKLSEVADLSQLPTVGSLDGTQLLMVGADVTGAPINLQIDLNAAGSTYSLDGGVTNLDIFDMNPAGRVAVPADDMTYQQLLDVINIVTSGVPIVNTPAGYDTSVKSSNLVSQMHMGYDGKIQYEQFNVANTQTEISLFDSNSGDFAAGASVMSFNSNNAIEVRDPKTDFFKVLDTMILSVENHKLYADASEGDIRSVGIEDSIAMIDDLQDHVLRVHAQVGSQVNALDGSLARTEMLQISAMTLRSDVIDTDLAQASLQLTQLSLNYEAMLSTVGKVSKLNLVNYL